MTSAFLYGKQPNTGLAIGLHSEWPLVDVTPWLQHEFKSAAVTVASIGPIAASNGVLGDRSSRRSVCLLGTGRAGGKKSLKYGRIR